MANTESKYKRTDFQSAKQSYLERKKNPPKNINTIVFQLVKVEKNSSGIESTEVVKDHILPVLPTTFTMSDVSRDTVEHTLGGIHIQRWGVNAYQLQMEGKVLNQLMLSNGKDRDGESRFKDLRDMLRNYAGSNTKEGNISPSINIRTGSKVKSYDRDKIKLYIYIMGSVLAPSSKEEISNEWYECATVGSYFTFSKNVTNNNFQFPFRLQLTLIRRLTVGIAPLTENQILGLEYRGPPDISYMDILRGVFSPLTKIQDTINRFTEGFENFKNAFNRFQNSITSFVEFPFATARSLVRDADEIFSSYSSLIAIPDEISQKLDNTIDYINNVLSRPALFLPEFTGSKKFNSAKPEKIDDTTTLDELSIDNGVEIEDIIEFNNLQYPYISANITDGIYDETKRVLDIGDTVLIPQLSTSEDSDRSRGTVGNLNSIESAKSLEERTFLKSWSLNTSGNMSGNSAKTGFLTVAGFENMQQAIRTRIITIKGQVYAYPDYGTEDMFGSAGSTLLVELLRADVNIQLLRDYRIDTVPKLSIKIKNGLLEMDFMVQLIQQSEAERLYIENIKRVT